MHPHMMKSSPQAREFTTTGHTPKTRDALKNAFRLAINRAGSRSEARRLDRLRGRYFAGNLKPDEALIAWMDLKLEAKETPNKNVWAP